ncbi:MAG: hypothetical protein J5382_11975 [Bacteroidales bacterium]|nr:hypothetical protein [Bacteroidales bacterium]
MATRTILDKTGLTYFWSKVKAALSGKEDAANKVTSISVQSTHTQYPSAKCVYDALQNAGGGNDSALVHKTGAETVGGVKTFSDGIAVPDASHIAYSGSGGGSQNVGFQHDTDTQGTSGAQQSIAFTDVMGEPKAFVIRLVLNRSSVGSGVASVISLVGDSEGIVGVYTSGSQHNYSSGFTASFSGNTLTITAPSGISFNGGYQLEYYYGSGTLTFRKTSFAPGSGVTSTTVQNLAGKPQFFSLQLESQVNSESYHRVASVVGYDDDGYAIDAFTFYGQNVYDTTSNFTVNYNNGLYLNSGGQNSGGYFHNPGTYRLYYLTEEDVGSGGGSTPSYDSLDEELADKEDSANKVTSLSASSTNDQYPSAKCVYDLVGNVESLLAAL